MSDTATPELNKALAAFQAEIPKVDKRLTADMGTFKSNYAPLEDVTAAAMPLLGEHGLSLSMRPTLEDGKFVLAYSLRHASGEHQDGTYPLPERGTPQQIGSALTYARRYILCAVTGVAPGGEDDDGAAVSQQEVHMDRVRPTARPPSDVPSRPVTPGPRPGPELEQLRHGTVERTPADRTAERGQLPPGQNPWQGEPPEEQPGSATREQVTGVQMEYQRLGFTRTERAQVIACSEQIIGRPLTGPNAGQTHNNLSYAEAVRLKDKLAGTTKRADLVGELAERAAGAAAQDAAEASQDDGDTDA